MQSEETNAEVIRLKEQLALCDKRIVDLIKTIEEIEKDYNDEKQRRIAAEKLAATLLKNQLASH